MKDIEKRLSPNEFVRVHRSFIVRIDKIVAIDHANVVLEDDKRQIPVGGSYKEELQNKINSV